MNPIRNLEAQHHALAAMMLRLINLAHGFHGRDHAYEIAVELAKLANLLRLHLKIEDEWFYPAMRNAADERTRVIASAYQAEVCAIGDRVEGFLQRWNSSTVIALGFDEFRSDLIDLFHKIEDRIDREEKHLFPAGRLLGVGRPQAAA